MGLHLEGRPRARRAAGHHQGEAGHGTCTVTAGRWPRGAGDSSRSGAPGEGWGWFRVAPGARDSRLPGSAERTWGAGTRLRCVVRAPPGPPCLLSQLFLAPGAADSFNGSCFGSLPSPSWKGPGPPLSLPALVVAACTCGPAQWSGGNVPTCAGWTEPAPPVLACLDACFCTPPWTRTPYL